jgi:ABC-type transport system substrate-binding protein
MLKIKCAIMLAVLLLAGCGEKENAATSVADKSSSGVQEGARQPVTGDWLVMHALSDPEQLNPLTSNDAAAGEILQHILQSLLTRDPRTLKLRPLIARSRPTISADKRTYTFELRRDVHFQDGKPLTGEDVRRIQDPGAVFPQ